MQQKSGQHPLILRALERYVRKPLEGSFLDTMVFSPSKMYYLQSVRALQECEHGVMNKME
eukprot:3938848-Rhodomonas_salina.1